MVSLIDPVFPVAGIDQPSQGFRDNFQAAKTEIESLQSDVASLQANPVITILNDLTDVDTTTTPPIVNDVLTFDGIDWVPSAGGAGALNNVVEDLTPQLGGNLDVNDFIITVSDVLNDTIQFIGRIKVIDDNSTLASSNLQLFSNNPNAVDGSFISARRSRGTHFSPTAVENGDLIGDYAHRGFDGTSYSRNFFIRTTATENHTPTTLGTETTFNSAADGASATAVRMRIDQEGQFQFQDAAGLYVLSNATTDATVTELFVNGDGSTQLDLPDDTTWLFRVSVVGRRTDANDESAGYTFEGVIDRNVGVATTAIAGAVTKTTLAEDNGPWEADVDADISGGALRIRVTGEAAKNVSWVAKIETVEITG